ncbi:MarR family winged helix-turn-helix transcriptional regulator [Paenarthrobacter sp. RAF54_2]
MGKTASVGDTVELNPNQRVIDEALGSIIRWSLYEFHALLVERSGVSIDRSMISILTRLSATGTLRISDLANRLGLDRSTLSRQVAAAVTAGYVSRTTDESDSRAYLVSMTDEGKAAYRAVRLARTRIMVEMTRQMSSSELDQVSNALPILARAINSLSTSVGSEP